MRPRKQNYLSFQNSSRGSLQYNLIYFKFEIIIKFKINATIISTLKMDYFVL